MWPLFHDITVKFPSVLIPFSPSPLIGSLYISKIKYYLSQHTAVLCSAIFYYLLCCMMEDNVHPLNNRTNDGVPFWNVFDYQKRKCMIYIKMPKKNGDRFPKRVIIIIRGKFGYIIESHHHLPFDKSIICFFLSVFFIFTCYTQNPVFILRQAIIMSLLKTICVREIAGKPVAHRMFLQNFIEDLPIFRKFYIRLWKIDWLFSTHANMN